LVTIPFRSRSLPTRPVRMVGKTRSYRREEVTR